MAFISLRLCIAIGALNIGVFALAGCSGSSAPHTLQISSGGHGSARSAYAAASQSVTSLPVHTSTANGFTEYSGISSGSGPMYLAFKADGTVWFTEQGTNSIGEMANANFTEYAIPWSDNNSATGITIGPDNHIWFTEFSGTNQNPSNSAGGSVGVFEPCDASFTEVVLAPPNASPVRSAPWNIVNGVDGNLWIADNASACPTCNGVATIGITNNLPTFFENMTGEPVFVGNGPDGNMWFTENTNNGSITSGGPSWIGKLSPQGALLSQYPVYGMSNPLRTSAYLNGITQGPDGNVWFVDSNNGAIGYVQPSNGAVTILPQQGTGWMIDIVPGPTSGPYQNTLWVTDWRNGKIGYISTAATPGDQITWLTTPGTQPSGLTLGPDGNMWFAEHGSSRLAEFALH